MSALVVALHYNNGHWTAKPGVDDGRYLFDCANIANGSTINSEFAFAAAEELYLPLRHPTILENLTGMVKYASDIGCLLSDLRFRRMISKVLLVNSIWIQRHVIFWLLK